MQAQLGAREQPGLQAQLGAREPREGGCRECQASYRQRAPAGRLSYYWDASLSMAVDRPSI